MASDFVSNLSKELVEKKNVAETTAHSYLRTLILLNDKKPLKNLAFLRNKEEVMKKVGEYSESTQKTVLAALTSVLSLFKEKPTYKAVHRFYQDKMLEKMKDVSDVPAGEKNEKQTTNWMEWKEIKELSATMYAKAREYASKKALTPKEAEHLLNTVVLCLYTCVPPRRNQDYLDMLIVKKWNDKMPNTHNYLDIAGSQFIFNKYKTAKKYGTQTVKIPNDDANPLMDVLTAYLRHHDLYKATKGKEPVPFLIQNGAPLTAANAITRILNKIFGKKVGSSMLRHIFLSDKYADVKEEQEADAEAMGHSVAEQQGVYVKK
jgi:integrase